VVSLWEVVDIQKLNARILEIVKGVTELRKAIDEIVNELKGGNNE
jgi:hypothetical protein